MPENMRLKVEVRLFADLREVAGAGSVLLDFGRPPTVGDVIDATIAKFPALAQSLKPNGKFNHKYKVLVGQSVVPPEGFAQNAGPRVALLPPVSGG